MTPARSDTPELGPLLHRARQRQALTGQAVADACKVSRQAVSDWEHSRWLPAATLIRNGDGPGPLAQILDLPWQRLAKARARDIERRRRTRLLS